MKTTPHTALPVTALGLFQALEGTNNGYLFAPTGHELAAADAHPELFITRPNSFGARTIYPPDYLGVRPRLIAWNTGRWYTDAGQRIAALAIDGGVYMADVDRGVDYFLPCCALDRSAIMARYDENDRTDYAPPSLFGTSKVREVRTILETLARTLPPA